MFGIARREFWKICNEIMGVVVLDLVVFGFFCRWPNLKSGCLSLYAIVSQTNRSHEKPGSLECLNFALHLFISRIIVQTATDRYYSVLLKDSYFSDLVSRRNMCWELSMPEN